MTQPRFPIPFRRAAAFAGAALLAIGVQACGQEAEQPPLADEAPIEATPAAPDAGRSASATAPADSAPTAAPTLPPSDPASPAQTARPTTGEQIEEYDRALERRTADTPEPIEQGD